MVDDNTTVLLDPRGINRGELRLIVLALRLAVQGDVKVEGYPLAKQQMASLADRIDSPIYRVA